jgi:hypothetical protein
LKFIAYRKNFNSENIWKKITTSRDEQTAFGVNSVIMLLEPLGSLKQACKEKFG